MRLAVASLAILAFACTSKPAAADEKDKGSLTYQLEVPKDAVKVKAGDSASFKLALKPQGDSHVDPRAPLNFDVKAGDSVTLAKASLGHADGKELPTKAIEFDVPFTGKAAGSDQIKVHADFYLCTPKLCERQSADVAIVVVIE